LRFLERMATGSRRQFSRFPMSIILLFLMSTPAESACVDDALARVHRDTLLMDSKTVYRVLDDPRAVVFWLPLSKVTICDQVGNVDDEVAIYYEIRNQDKNQMVRAVRERWSAVRSYIRLKISTLTQTPSRGALFARKDIQEIARFITTESVLLHEHFRRLLAAACEQSLSHLSGNLSFREKQRRSWEMSRNLSLFCHARAFGSWTYVTDGRYSCALYVQWIRLGYSRIFSAIAGVWRGDNSGALETKYLVATPISAPVGHRRHIRRYLLCFAEKSVPMKS
jgi:hypothetical protein